MKGNLFVVSGPSGSGKSTICKSVIEKDDHIKLSVSATTRHPRANEKNGVEYYFLTLEEFNEKVNQNEFYEHAKIYENYYGTLKKPVDNLLQCGYDVILEIEMQGAKQIKAKNSETVCIFIMPPSLDELADRLEKRNTETQDQFRMRIGQAVDEIAEKVHYDHIVENLELDTAVDEVLNIIHSYRKM